MALEDGEPLEEEEMWRDFLGKAEKARDQAAVAKEDCEGALRRADLAKRTPKASLTRLAKRSVKTLKDILAKQEKAMKLEKAKAFLVEIVSKTKEIKGETKELIQLANKAGSKASTKR